MDEDDKKKRATRSCDACAHRKVRCLGGAPCTRCAKLHIDCNYTRPERKRGPPRGSTSKVHARLRALESLVAGTLGLDPKDVGNMEIGNMEIGNMEIGQVEIGASNQAVEVYYPLSEHSGSPSSVSPPIPMPAEHQASFISPLNSAGASNSLGSTASVSFPASSSSHASASSSTSTHLEANKQTNLPFTNIFQILFHTDDEEMATTAEPPSSEDPESPCSSLEDFANSVNDLIRVPKTAPLKMTSSVVNPPNPANPYLDLILGTAQPIFHDLLALYFTHVAPFSPIIHRTTFLSNPSSYPPLLLNAMYAAASLYAPTSPETQGRGYAAAPFLARARALLDPLAKPDLRTVQALVLLIKSGAAARKLTIRETDALVAMAAGLIRASRFDQPDSTHRVSPVRASEIKRTVAIIWMLDVYLKALNDRTASFSPTFTPARDPGSIPCTDPGWVIPSQGPVANITLFLSARDAIVLPPTSPSNDLVQTDPHAAILEIHRLFSSAHEMHCPSLSPAIASPSSILSRAEALQSAYRTARLASPVYLCGRTLAHSGMNILLYKQGGWDFSELVMDLEAAMLAIQGTGGWLELGSPFAAWALFHLAASLPPTHIARSTFTRALASYGTLIPLGSHLAGALESGITKPSNLADLKPRERGECKREFVRRVEGIVV